VRPDCVQRGHLREDGQLSAMRREARLGQEAAVPGQEAAVPVRTPKSVTASSTDRASSQPSRLSYSGAPTWPHRNTEPMRPAAKGVSVPKLGHQASPSASLLAPKTVIEAALMKKAEAVWSSPNFKLAGRRRRARRRW
jgi:hypothetical protein